MAHQLNEAELLSLGMSRVNIATLREIARVAGVGGTVSTNFTIADIEMLILGIRDMAAPYRRLEQAIEALESVTMSRRDDIDSLRRRIDAMEQDQLQKPNLTGILQRLDTLEQLTG